MDASKGVVRVGRRIDFESVANFTVSVRAKDSGHPELQSVATLQVTVLDVDDLNPVFEHDSYDATIDQVGILSANVFYHSIIPSGGHSILKCM
jgi:hypothetical protein